MAQARTFVFNTDLRLSQIGLSSTGAQAGNMIVAAGESFAVHDNPNFQPASAPSPVAAPIMNMALKPV